MGLPAAKQNDLILSIDLHFVPEPLPHPFIGRIDNNLSSNVKIRGMSAATVNSTATNTPAHFPTPPGVEFLKPPSNRGTIKFGSFSVKINGKMAARMSDIAMTCNDPVDLPIGHVIATDPSVLIG